MPSDQQAVVFIELTGALDNRAAEEFEHETAELFRSGSRFFVIGFERVDMMMSAGIRVLLELTRMLQGQQGGLLLYGLNARVRAVLSVTRLVDQFQIVVSKDDAMRAVAARRQSAEGCMGASPLARLVGQVLGSGRPTSAALLPAGGPKSALTVELARLLDGSDA